MCTKNYLKVVLQSKCRNLFIMTCNKLHPKVQRSMYVYILRAGVQPTLDPYAEAFL